MQSSPPKLLPRNAAALRAGQDAAALPRIVAGNSVATRLELGVGNCFPGLECDLRNLERRFFPFLEIDVNIGASTQVASVDLSGVEAALGDGRIEATAAQSYREIERDLRQGTVWSIARIDGNLGPLGQLSLGLDEINGLSFGDGRPPPDPWTAVRMLVEDSLVKLELVRASPPGRLTLSGKRMRYLDDTGALARMFEPGELTQSLCSPWTYDFRDCSCFYWAANHPDIALPPLPAPPPPPNDRRWSRLTSWERADRSIALPPLATENGPREVREIAHHQINRDWQLLNFVLERRERLEPYSSTVFEARPFAGLDQLLSQLRYAAGVELAVMQEYLTAAWSLKDPAGEPQPLRDDLRAAFAEILRIAIGEMRHLRAINEVLAALSPAGSFVPALAVAAQVPDSMPGTFRPLSPSAATPDIIDRFIAIEAPWQSVDGLYSRILATFETGVGSDEQEQAIRTIMAEGEDHWQTFLFVREWLGRHPPASYLRAPDLQPPPTADAEHQTLQQRYRALLELLHRGYQSGIPAGAADINTARNAMLAPDGIRGAVDAVAAQGFLAVFDPLADPRFAPINPP